MRRRRAPGRAGSTLPWIAMLLIALTGIASTPGRAVASEPPAAGTPLHRVLEAERAAGLPLAWSSNLVGDDLEVRAPPRAASGVAMLEEVLRPHGLALRYSDGLYLVVRAPSTNGPPATTPPPAPVSRPDPPPPAIEEINVTASRYRLFANSRFIIDQRAIQNLPDIGDDPIRAVHRLPGTAAGEWSAKSHFRGGTEDESAIYLNGLALLDPFHVRDFHNVFSAIDARAIDGVEAWTGGFPTPYGDRMSGVLVLNTRPPRDDRHYELGLSVFNTSLLASGRGEGGRADWLVSARRSNLQYVLDATRHGKPEYNDIFGTLGWQVNDAARLAFNVLRAEDDVLVITEHKPEDEESSTSDTLNEYAWLQWTHDWRPGLSSETVLSWMSFSNDRDAHVNDPEQLVARVADRREVRVAGLRQDWRWAVGERHRLAWGWEVRDEKADYDYRADADYFDDYLVFPGVPESLRRRVRASPSGQAVSLWASDRWRALPWLTVETGLRWDRQDWQGPAAGDQFSPRVSLLAQTGERLDWRLTWGRYHQSQGIDELQVADGVDGFFPAQRARHLIVGAALRLGDVTRLRVEAFRKDYDHLGPRYENFLDPLPLIPELEVDRIRVAPESARSSGLELTLEQDYGPELNGWLSYTLARVDDRVNGRAVPRNWDQRHAVQGGVAWEPGPWQLGAAIAWRSGWPTTAAFLVGDEDDPRVVYGPRNAERLGEFFNLDIRVARAWRVGDGRLTAFLEVSNLTNRRNPCCVDYDIEEDAADEEYLERSVDDWLRITPAVGLLWEF